MLKYSLEPEFHWTFFFPVGLILDRFLINLLEKLICLIFPIYNFTYLFNQVLPPNQLCRKPIFKICHQYFDLS